MEEPPDGSARKLVLSHPDYKPVCIIEISGFISAGTVKRFKKALEEARQDYTCWDNTTLVLKQSAGGNVRPSIQIMDIIISEGMETLIQQNLVNGEKNYCLSSCALIFATGFKRYFRSFDGNNKTIGIHRMHSYKTGSTSEDHIGMIISVYEEHLTKLYEWLGISPQFFKSVTQTDFKSMRYESLDNLLDWGVISSLELPPSWMLSK